jgi:hypothetical protein
MKMNRTIFIKLVHTRELTSREKHDFCLIGVKNKVIRTRPGGKVVLYYSFQPGLFKNNPGW